MILDILLLIDESKSLSESSSPVVWINISIKSLSDGSSDKYISDIIDVSDYYRYRLKFFLIICIVL